jgi:hypothetical protein
MKKNEPVPEPCFYIALVLKGNETQYMKLLEFINNEDVGQVIYQCKSQTYLAISREDNVDVQADFPQTILHSQQSKRQTALCP